MSTAGILRQIAALASAEADRLAGITPTTPVVTPTPQTFTGTLETATNQAEWTQARDAMNPLVRSYYPVLFPGSPGATPPGVMPQEPVYRPVPWAGQLLEPMKSVLLTTRQNTIIDLPIAPGANIFTLTEASSGGVARATEVQLNIWVTDANGNIIGNGRPEYYHQYTGASVQFPPQPDRAFAHVIARNVDGVACYVQVN